MCIREDDLDFKKFCFLISFIRSFDLEENKELCSFS
jgi:hypothetical protein